MAVTDQLLSKAFRSYMIAELSSNLKTQAGIAAMRIAPELFRKQKEAGLKDLAYDLGRACSCRVTLIAGDGLVLRDSTFPLDRLGSFKNHKSRPEIHSALEGIAAAEIRHSDTIGEDLLYAASPVLSGKNVTGVVRLAIPLTQVEKRVTRMRKVIAMITFCMMMAAIWISIWISRSISRPLSSICLTAQKLAGGDFGARVAGLPPGEHRQLGDTLNLLAEKIQQDITQLRRLEQVRKDFVANVSHELRTPLATVKACAETLKSGAVEDPENRMEFLQEIEKSSDRMARLVDDLLTLSAIESGQRPPVFEPVSVMDITEEVAASLKPLAEKKSVTISLAESNGLPRISADKRQLKQVFTNLLGNAIKFVEPEGKILVSAAAKDGKVTVSVSDNGAGIPGEHLPRIFERFYRVDKSRSSELGGTGLGLAIVKHIVEAHGGSVGVESVSGRGSTFHFTLPAAH